MPRVHLPEKNAVIDFPEGTPEAEIKQALDRQFYQGGGVRGALAEALTGPEMPEAEEMPALGSVYGMSPRQVSEVNRTLQEDRAFRAEQAQEKVKVVERRRELLQQREHEVDLHKREAKLKEDLLEMKIGADEAAAIIAGKADLTEILARGVEARKTKAAEAELPPKPPTALHLAQAKAYKAQAAQAMAQAKKLAPEGAEKIFARQREIMRLQLVPNWLEAMIMAIHEGEAAGQVTSEEAKRLVALFTSKEAIGPMGGGLATATRDKEGNWTYTFEEAGAKKEVAAPPSAPEPPPPLRPPTPPPLSAEELRGMLGERVPGARTFISREEKVEYEKALKRERAAEKRERIRLKREAQFSPREFRGLLDEAFGR